MLRQCLAYCSQQAPASEARPRRLANCRRSDSIGSRVVSELWGVSESKGTGKRWEPHTWSEPAGGHVCIETAPAPGVGGQQALP